MLPRNSKLETVHEFDQLQCQSSGLSEICPCSPEINHKQIYHDWSGQTRDSFYILASASPRQPQSFRTCSLYQAAFSDVDSNKIIFFPVVNSLWNCSLANSGTYKSRSATERTKYKQPASCDRFPKVLRWCFRINSDWSSAVWRQLPTGVSQTKPPEMTHLAGMYV